MKTLKSALCFFVGLLLFQACSPPEPGSIKHIQTVTAKIDDKRLVNIHEEPGNWLTHGLNYKEDRYSTLTQINKENIDQLGLVWSVNLDSKRGLEATPLVVDGIMYVSAAWSKVFAIDVRKGEKIWTYDPKVPGSYGEKACCDVVNRGLALYRGKVYVGTLDGRLIALDAASGSPVWEKLTVDTSKAYTITGAPRVVGGKVIIGNGGAEYGVRGYITAYDAETGAQQWRFYTVPGDPSKPFESKAMEKAAETWTGNWWKYGGGGTCWDAMAFDPALNLLYVGTGNGSPWNRAYRSPNGGDNLYLSSILAINPDNGELVWYYQTTPGDTWDYTATQHLMLADLQIEGQMRKVIMQAPKNGFFYVLDRTDGELISAQPFTYVNWATEIDMNTGRPVETPFSRYQDVNAVIFPGPFGGHNWQPMALNKKHNLVYLPVRNLSMQYGHAPNWQFDDTKNVWNLGTGFDPTKTIREDTIAPKQVSRLLAWDPIKQREVWSVENKHIFNSGVLATASDLVFQGTAEGLFKTYDAITGDSLWSMDLKTGIIGSPVTYEVDGVQYLSIAVGWGGVHGRTIEYTENINPGTLYTFALGGKAPVPEYEHPPAKEMTNLTFVATAEELANGGMLYGKFCWKCHGEIGIGGGVMPDLAYSTEGIYNNFHSILLEGALEPIGMPNFQGRISKMEADDIKNYILFQVEKKRTSLTSSL